VSAALIASPAFSALRLAPAPQLTCGVLAVRIAQVLGDGSGLTVLGGPTLQGMDPHHHHPQQQQQQQYFTLPGGMPMLQPGSTGQQLLGVSQAGHHMGPSPEPQQVVMVSRDDPSGLPPGAPWLMAMPQLPVGLNGAVGAGGQQVVVLGQPGQG
jgi:hypothetical protein